MRKYPNRDLKWFFTNYVWNFIQTTIHKFWVFYYVAVFSSQLLWRGVIHDLSKYSNQEAFLFADAIFDLKKIKYGTPEYKESLEKIRPCLEHHYSKNSHHPQFYKNGFKDMGGLDLIEMVADWKASTKRHKDSNIFTSIEINQKRFEYSNDDKIWIEKMAKEIS